MPSPRSVLYSFPNRIGAARICHTAWQQANGIANAGARVHVLASSFAKPLTKAQNQIATLGVGPWRLPLKYIPRKLAASWHDWLTSRWLRRHAQEIDVVHAWPLGSLRTLKTARSLGIPTVLERPNAHTGFAYRVTAEELNRLGLQLPADHDHAFNEENLAHELVEYGLADFLLCPSDFVRQTFLDEGFPAEKLLRHRYGCDKGRFFFNPQQRFDALKAIYVGVCEPRKGLHYALEAWHAAGPREGDEFLICGAMVDGYEKVLAPYLAHPSVKMLGHRKDVADLMRGSNVFILPTIEEGSALVTYEARASGCVLVVSSAAGAVCEHGVNALVHAPRHTATLTEHLQTLRSKPSSFADLWRSSVADIDSLFWDAAADSLLRCYDQAIAAKPRATAPSHP